MDPLNCSYHKMVSLNKCEVALFENEVASLGNIKAAIWYCPVLGCERYELDRAFSDIEIGWLVKRMIEKGALRDILKELIDAKIRLEILYARQRRHLDDGR